ncbi:MAG: isoleucine--tRNA ligase [Phycisphaerales bacterium]|nr:isoleucine--tRNA ligase [Phycisphaerales bacterium]
MTAPTPTSLPSPADTGAAKTYKDTLNLPKTAFPMKANLVQNEPATLKRWASLNNGEGLYAAVRKARAGASPFTFHDGPPYANGSIHLGHLMNKVLKDLVVRTRTMAGLDTPYIPGWDCHGLPIEHKVMTELVESGKADKLATLTDDQRRMAVRRECRKYAEKYHKLHTQQMMRLLTLADYEHPYLTMNPEYEGAVLEVLAGLMERGLVYRALKPVHWSIANETALAEAELEYYDREDHSVYVDFEAADGEAVYDAFGLVDEPETEEDDGDDDDDESAQPDAESAGEPRELRGRPTQRPTFMIWTTTPWTLPANLAIAVNPEFTYALVRIDGNITVMAEAAVERVTKAARAESARVLATVKGEKLVGLKYRHPFVDHTGPAHTAPAVFTVVAADYVTLEDGTGLVHTAPGHGVEDYQTGLRIGLPIYCPVRGNGTYDDTVPQWLRGKDVWAANELVTRHLRDSGHLFYDHKFTHSYPHDWRSKTPTIFRSTEQWFVGVDKPMTGAHNTTLRAAALAKTASGVTFVPEWGRNRMRGMLESRPDWCISRQRAWGLPIPAFMLPDGSMFMTAASVLAVARAVREKGSDVWFTGTPEELLKHYDAASDPEVGPAKASAVKATLVQSRKGGDILDVWFESGSSWNAVLRERGLPYPADLYLEGSDQHRGWFQLSLLPALGVTGESPFKTLLTHGFINDRDGKKLSKSRPDAKDYEVDNLLANFGADVMRWWVATLSYENDVKADTAFFTVSGESYRKVRNTLRFMLSNLYDFGGGDGAGPGGTGLQTSASNSTALDAWVLSEYQKLAQEVTGAYEAYDFRAATSRLYDFCNDTLSATYLAAVKDRLYCDRADSARRRGTQTTLFALTDGLCRLLAPIMPHTADEAYRELHGGAKDAQAATRCVHVEKFVTSLGTAADAGWASVLRAREAALQAIEKAKGELGVENPLDAGVVLPDPEGVLARFDPRDLADLLGASRVVLERGATEVRILDLRSEARCERSWKRDGTVKRRSDGGMLTDRDAEAVGVDVA